MLEIHLGIVSLRSDITFNAQGFTRQSLTVSVKMCIEYLPSHIQGLKTFLLSMSKFDEKMHMLFSMEKALEIFILHCPLFPSVFLFNLFILSLETLKKKMKKNPDFHGGPRTRFVNFSHILTLYFLCVPKAPPPYPCSIVQKIDNYTIIN